MPVTTPNENNMSIIHGLQSLVAMIRMFQAAVMTGTNVLTSAILDTSMLNGTKDLSLELQWTGTPTGTFLWEGSNSYDPSTNPGATFITIPTAQTSPSLTAGNPAGAAGSYLGSLVTNVERGSAKWVRLRYTNATGVGALDGWAFLRGVAR